MKFGVELGENSAETSEILKTAFGNDCSSCARKYEWFTKFKEGRNSGDDDPRPRRTSTSRRLCEFVQIGDKQYAKFLRRLAYNKGTCQATFTENLNT